MAERKTVSLRIDPDVWKKARKHAIDKEMKISELVEKVLKKEINKD